VSARGVVQDVTVRLATQRELGGALVGVADIDVEDGELCVLVGVGAPVGIRPRWVARGGSLAAPGWGVLRVCDVHLGSPASARFEFVPEPGGVR